MHEHRSGFFFFGLSVFILWESLRLELGTLREPGSGFLSFCTGGALFALSLVLILRGRGAKEPTKPHSLRALLAIISLFAYSLVLNRLGFIPATFLLTAVLFRLGEPRQWWVLIGAGALVTLIIYLVFGVFLHVYFPRGVLGI